MNSQTIYARCFARYLALLVSCGLLMVANSSFAQTAQEGKNLGALAPENLNKKRAKAPVDFTGTWNFKIEAKNGRHLFMPMPMLTVKAQAAVAKRDEYVKKGLEYRDDSAACWPLGMPRMMTRFWPIQIVQLPTEILLITMFNNNVRWIYTDGRKHPPEDEIVFTYNGHSIGHWEGNTMVVDTVGMTDDHKWIQEGVPTGSKLRVTERYTLVDDGKGIDVEFRMTDPDNWIGEWVNTKHYDRDDHGDIEEHICIYEQVKILPSFKFNVRE